MKRTRWVAWLLWMGLIVTASSTWAANMTTIDSARLEAMMADGKGLVIVDVREPELFVHGHIKGAINIPYDDAKPRIVKELSPQDRIVFVCHGGPMGDELGRLMAGKGYPAVYNLAGGMKKWKGALVQ